MQTLLISVQAGAPQPTRVAFGTAGGTIGRADTNTLVLSDPERSVSRLHARIDWRDGAFTLVNLGINPVLCNGTVLITGVDTLIAPGDQLRMGRFTLAVEANDSGLVPPPAYLRTQPLGAATAPRHLEPAPEEGESLFDDMTGLPLPRAARRPDVTAPDIFLVDDAAQPAELPTLLEPVAQSPRSAPLSAEEVWLAELLQGMGCAVPAWPSPLTARQVGQVGALMRAALDASLRDGASGQAWFVAFEQAFLRACAAGLGEAPELDLDPTAPQ